MPKAGKSSSDEPDIKPYTRASLSSDEVDFKPDAKASGTKKKKTTSGKAVGREWSGDVTAALPCQTGC